MRVIGGPHLPWGGGHDDGGQLRAVRAALLPGPRAATRRRSATRCWCPPTPGPRWPSASGRRSGSTTTWAGCRCAPGWPPTSTWSGTRRTGGRRAEARVAARRLVREHGLPMKVIARRLRRTSPTCSRSTSARRTGSTSARWSATWPRGCAARVELRQIGPRDEARLQGGIGPCGRDLCCSTFLKDFEPVSVRMAKDQDLPVNPLRIAGACGRLMCCLKYEHPLYQDFRRTAPSVGERGRHPGGPGHGRRAQRAGRHRSW